ncbi:hypothetical protein K501DRAFT_335274 [Backusella circina FSU 941]|nr:hypothetical protein K501DRAFT_335274 [Backusella circina FSU 941]
MSKNRQFALPKSFFSASTLKRDITKEKEEEQVEEEEEEETPNKSSSSPEISKPLKKKQKRITIDLDSENESSSNSETEELESSDESSSEEEQESLSQVILVNRLNKLFLKLERRQAHQAKLIELTRTANKRIKKTNRHIEHLVNALAERKYERTSPAKHHKKSSKIKSEQNEDDQSLFLNPLDKSKKPKWKS